MQFMKSCFLPLALFVQIGIHLSAVTSYGFLFDRSNDPVVDKNAPPPLVMPGLYLVDRGDHEMYIREVTNGTDHTYYAFLKFGNGQFTSLYEVKAEINGNLTFYPMIQTKSFQFMPDYQRPIYTVKQDLTESRRTLKIEWTGNADNFGSNIHCTLKPEFKFAGNKRTWGDFSTLQANTVLSLNGKRNREDAEGNNRRREEPIPKDLTLNITRSVQDPNNFFIKSDNLYLETSYSERMVLKDLNRSQNPIDYKAPAKTFGSAEGIPGLLLSRAKIGDSLLGIGGDLASEISYILVPIVDRDKQVKMIHVLRMAPGVPECGYVTVGVKVK